jgi:hypothetical protein
MGLEASIYAASREGVTAETNEIMTLARDRPGVSIPQHMNGRRLTAEVAHLRNEVKECHLTEFGVDMGTIRKPSPSKAARSQPSPCDIGCKAHNVACAFDGFVSPLSNVPTSPCSDREYLRTKRRLGLCRTENCEEEMNQKGVEEAARLFASGCGRSVDLPKRNDGFEARVRRCLQYDVQMWNVSKISR